MIFEPITVSNRNLTTVRAAIYVEAFAKYLIVCYDINNEIPFSWSIFLQHAIMNTDSEPMQPPPVAKGLRRNRISNSVSPTRLDPLTQQKTKASGDSIRVEIHGKYRGNNDNRFRTPEKLQYCSMSSCAIFEIYITDWKRKRLMGGN